jgi:hypothetical protein
MKALKYFGELIVRGAIIGLVAGYVISYTAQFSTNTPISVEAVAPMITDNSPKQKEAIPGVPREMNPQMAEMEKRMMNEATVDELKVAYKACNRTLSEGKLDRGGIQMCAIVYETLKKKGFDNDYLKFYEWSKTW